MTDKTRMMTQPTPSALSIAGACKNVLLTAHPQDKLMLARKTARQWRMGQLRHDFDVDLPDNPAQPEQPKLLPPNQMPKRGKAGSLRARIALLHSLAHIEFAAIDLAFDMAARFGGQFPREFINDWMSVGADEAMHFALLDRRLKQLGSHYGALPAHNGLWEAAQDTAHNTLARLAIVPMVLEARGLDITPVTIDRLTQNGDLPSAKILQRIYKDEIRHVYYGTKWFRFACGKIDKDPPNMWKSLVSQHFKGVLKPPFNDSARKQAGLSRAYYGDIV